MQQAMQTQTSSILDTQMRIPITIECLFISRSELRSTVERETNHVLEAEIPFPSYPFFYNDLESKELALDVIAQQDEYTDTDSDIG